MLLFFYLKKKAILCLQYMWNTFCSQDPIRILHCADYLDVVGLALIAWQIEGTWERKTAGEEDRLIDRTRDVLEAVSDAHSIRYGIYSNWYATTNTVCLQDFTKCLNMKCIFWTVKFNSCQQLWNNTLQRNVRWIGFIKLHLHLCNMGRKNKISIFICIIFKMLPWLQYSKNIKIKTIRPI